jgi:hypothetical protein
VSHWLDDVARGLAEGSLTRRAVLRRSGRVAGGALIASVTGPLASFSPVARAAGCPNVPCQPPEVCCGGSTCCNSNTHTCCEGLCIEDGGRVGCCGGRVYSRSKVTCCGETRCNKSTHFCCGDQCHLRSPDIGCCRGQAYDPNREICCPQPARGRHFCARNEQCCGATECCTKGEQCCNSGKLSYCAPKGRCCPKGQHRVTCGTGKRLCCPEGEYCCGGKCCKPSDCQNGVCSKGDCGGRQCPSGQKCCNPAMESCVTPFPAGPFCVGDCDGKPGRQVTCCPNGGSDACGAASGESHPACRGGQAGCVCSNGNFCPQSGCCDINGNCLNPCPLTPNARLKRSIRTLRGSARRR